MPQMAPLWWTTLFTMFIMSFMIMWTMMYYQYPSSPTLMKSKSMSEKYMNWKW